jgi:hypothetical protein
VIEERRLVTATLPVQATQPEPPATDARHALPVPAASCPAGTVRRFAADVAGAAVVVTVAPLCFLQAPNAIAWAMASPGPGGTEVMRAAGLALPAMAALGGVAALAVTRVRAWPVLLTGLLAMAAGDALGGAAHTVGLIGAARILHGAAAGVAMPAALALAWERRARHLLVALWATVTVTGLIAATAVVHARLAGGDWHAALAPSAWLTGAALTLAALYAVLADGPGPAARGSTGRLGTRTDATHERTQLAVLAVPGIGLSVLSVAVTFRQPAALLAAASVSIVILYGVAAVASADKLVGGRLCFPLIGAVTGLVVAPAAGAVTSLRALAPAAGAHGPAASWLPLAATAGSALAGAAAALLLRRRPGIVVLAGLAVTAESLIAARVAGPFASVPVLAGVSAPLAAGLAAAMTAALADASAASALSGVSLLLAGLMTGDLAAGSVQVRMVVRLAAAPSAARSALTGAAGLWELAGAGSVVIVMAAIIIAGRARRAGASARSRG